MSLKDYRFDGEEKLELRGMNTGAKKDGVDKEDILRRTEKNLGRIEALQDKLYADGRESVLIILQAMDAAGKDSTVKHVMGCVNPQGIDVHSFKQPTSEELSHDYLWRAMKALPARGKMALFNRSYYEDVLVVKVHALQKNYKMPARVLEDPDFFKKRYRQIRHFEEYLYENGCRVVKIFLNLSREKQKERFLERIQVEAKNWKFSQADIRERAYWNDYMDAYEVAVNETATRHSPWYVIPADQKWYTRYLVSEAVLGVLEDIDPHYPKLPPEHAAELQECREALEKEQKRAFPRQHRGGGTALRHHWEGTGAKTGPAGQTADSSTRSSISSLPRHARNTTRRRHPSAGVPGSLASSRTPPRKDASTSQPPSARGRRSSATTVPVQPRAGRMPALTCSASLPGAGASRRAAQSAASIHSPEGSCAHSARARGAAAAAHKSSTARPNRKYRRRERVMGRPPFKNSGKERFTALFIAYSCFYLVNECTQNRGFEMNDRS